MTPGTAAETAPVELCLAPALRFRLLGTGLAAIGLVVVLGVGLVWVIGAPTALATGLVVLGGLGVIALGLLLGRRRWALRLDENGYRVRLLHPQVRAARWSDVLDLRAVNVGRTRCLTLRLRDGRTTTLPVDSIEGGPVQLTKLLGDRLDRSNGYRRLS